MARVSNLLREFYGGLHNAHVHAKPVRLDLGEGQFDVNGNPTVLHSGHVIAAYTFYGSPWFCGYVGDSMGNQIRLRATRRT